MRALLLTALLLGCSVASALEPELTAKQASAIATIKQSRGHVMYSPNGAYSVSLGDTKDPDQILAQLKAVPNLRQVNIGNAPVTAAGLVHLENLEHLRTLSIGTFVVLIGATADGKLRSPTPDSARNLIESHFTDAELSELRNLKGLEHLDLLATQVTSTGLQYLEKLKHLKVLQLDHSSDITDDGLVHLKGLTELTHLKLTGTQVTDAGLVHLEGLTKLQRLDLAQTAGVTDAGLVHLKGMVDLEELNLRYTKTTIEGKEELKTVLPNCIIIQK